MDSDWPAEVDDEDEEDDDDEVEIGTVTTVIDEVCEEEEDDDDEDKDVDPLEVTPEETSEVEALESELEFDESELAPRTTGPTGFTGFVVCEGSAGDWDWDWEPCPFPPLVFILYSSLHALSETAATRQTNIGKNLSDRFIVL